MKLWAQYLHQNHWLITPAIVFLLLLLLIFFSKFTYICMNTIQWDPVNFRRDSARRKNKKIEIQTLWENSDPLGAIVLVLASGASELLMKVIFYLLHTQREGFLLCYYFLVLETSAKSASGRILQNFLSTCPASRTSKSNLKLFVAQ